MYLYIFFAIAMLTYFSAMLAYTYDIDDDCDCKVGWYFQYIRYFSMATIILRTILIAYVIVIILSQTRTLIWENNVVKYIILLLFVMNTLGNVGYIVSLFKYFENVEDNNNDCNCYQGKFYDIMRIASYIYIGIFIINASYFIANLASPKKY